MLGPHFKPLPTNQETEMQKFLLEKSFTTKQFLKWWNYLKSNNTDLSHPFVGAHTE